MIRAGRYWVPHWYKASHWIAYWDVFGCPRDKAALCPRHSGDLVVRSGQGGESSSRGADRIGTSRATESTETMAAYIIRRILFMIPTMFGIMLVSFVVVQFAPGGPVERVIAQLSGSDTGATSRISGSPGGDFGARGRRRAARRSTTSARNIAARRGSTRSSSRAGEAVRLRQAGLRALLPDAVELPAFDFGKSYFRDVSVLQLIKEKLPVSISLGIWMTLLTYLISIPLGIRKAVSDGSPFDIWTSSVIIVGYAIPGFLFAILLIVLFAGGSFFDWFPLRGLTSDNWAQLSLVGEDRSTISGT